MKDVRLIDANALHKRIEMNLRASNPFTIEECCYKDALNSVDEAPTIDPETLRPVAHWNGQYDGYYDGEPVCDVWECSNCGHKIDDGTDCEDNLPHYCPMCGAKMENDCTE